MYHIKTSMRENCTYVTNTESYVDTRSNLVKYWATSIKFLTKAHSTLREFKGMAAFYDMYMSCPKYKNPVTNKRTCISFHSISIKR